MQCPFQSSEQQADHRYLPSAAYWYKIRRPAGSQVARKQQIDHHLGGAPRRPVSAWPPLRRQARSGIVRVLLVEDETVPRAVATALLNALPGGVELDVAVDGAEAARRVRERGAYDLILSDRQMPVMDGHDATRQIRALGVTTPIVGVSSDCLPVDVDAFINAGADHFVPKPLSKEKLDSILTKFRLA